ncbi:MAG: HRDC domain-containing protein, partial [Acidimicrobiales bacterium]
LDAIAAPASPVAPADPPADLPEVRARVGAAHGPAIESSDLREALLEWRDAMARCSLVRPTVVVDDTAVERIVRDTPRSLDEIEEILGPGRARRWGADLLAMVESHRADQTSVAGSS